MEQYTTFKQRLLTLTHLTAALGVLSWDQEVMMPPKGAGKRAETIAELAGLLHERFLHLNDDALLDTLKSALTKGELDDRQEAVVREIARIYDREQKLSKEFVQNLALVTSEATETWKTAKEKSDFSMFSPHLKKIVTLKREEAQLIGFTDTPYDALLDAYEPDMKTAEVSTILNDVKQFLIPFLKKIQDSPNTARPELLAGSFPVEKQKAFSEMVAKTLGYDLDAGRIDVSAHPFSTSFSPLDSRITTRYDKTDISYALFSTMHEVGHALYEQGLNPEEFGTPLGEYISLGIHESQSRMYENQIGKSLEFWTFMYPKLQKAFPKPFASIDINDYYRAINHVTPSLIRTESDEVTYNLHIIIRFEIERNLIEGKIEVEDLPKIWNQKYKEYLGIDVPNDAQGVLQDIHWAHGSFGYFPTYSLGNLYCAQFFAAAKKAIPELEEELKKGDTSRLLAWLRLHIHSHGKYYTASQIVQNVTGEPLTSQHFKDYIQNKFSKIYDNTL